jgi:hypothetical protein
MGRMHSRIAVVAATLAWMCPAFAAEVTDVADAADTLRHGSLERDDPFDLYFGPTYEMSLQNGLITREPIDVSGNQSCTSSTARDCQPVSELRYTRAVHKLKLQTQIGLFQDLALTLGWSYIFADTLTFRYAKGVTAATSTVDRSNGQSYFPHDFTSRHAGSGDLELGLRFGVLNDERDESKPAWVLYFNWAAPWTTETWNPKDRATLDEPGPVGQGVHRLTFGTALSKRIGDFGLIGIDPDANRRGYLDPYMEFAYVLPVPQQGMALDELVKTDKNEFAERPSHEGHVNAGMEIVPLEDLKSSRKIALDFGLRASYFSDGRNYSELSDPLRELTYTEQFLRVGGIIGIYAQAAEFVRIKAGVVVNYTTEHFLTNEDIGEDRNDDGEVTQPEDDPVNPYFCGNDDSDVCREKGLPSYDQVGFRFKDEEHVTINWFVQLLLTF